MVFPPVVPPDTDAAAAARARQDTLTKPRGALGRLEDLSVWVASCQGHCPPKQFERARIVVFAGDHLGLVDRQAGILADFDFPVSIEPA